MDIACQHLTGHTQNQVIQQAGNECINLANFPLDIPIHNFTCVTPKHDTGKKSLMTSRDVALFVQVLFVFKGEGRRTLVD